jgi:LysR family transcriptional regulator, glycine cleavage system transcriptional activator
MTNKTHLPSMSALRAFEAVARQLSFTRAATELNLTQTAVTHQIRNLETALGLRLFERGPTGISLTDAGQTYLRSVRAALIEIAAASSRLSRYQDDDVLNIQCLGTYAIKQLLPRLVEFRARHPQITLRIQTMQHFAPDTRLDFDVAIWHGAGDWQGVRADRLTSDEIFPVCSPALLEREGPLASAQDLTGTTIIRTSSAIVPDEWPFWLEAAGLRELTFTSQINCDLLITSLQAAIDGLGVMLGRSTIVEHDLKSGRLIEPFNLRLSSPNGYFLVSPSRSTQLAKVEAFRAWLLE